MTDSPNVDAAEIAHFNRIARLWWDPHGKMGQLHAINGLRLRFITDRLTGFSRGYAYVTMSAQSEADKAVSMFNTFAWEDQRLKVTLVNPRASRGVAARF